MFDPLLLSQIPRHPVGVVEMTETYRFGRRIPLPSSVQILHELVVLSASEDAKQYGANESKSKAVASRATGVDAVEPKRSSA
jgi:hypothetical protein